MKVLVEIAARRPECFLAFEAGVASRDEAFRQAAALLDPLAGLSVDLDEDVVPVPMLSGDATLDPGVRTTLRAFAAPEESPDLDATSYVVAVDVPGGRLDDLLARPGVRVWPNSEVALLGVDCRPFRPGVDVATVRALLGVERIWEDGFRGQGVAVGVLDQGIDGCVYPVAGGFARPGAPQPGTAHVTSHGSMCAADVLVAAPEAKLYDYPFLGVPRSGGALAMFQAVLDNRRRDGTPHLTTNSWGFVSVPPRERFPTHEVHDRNHPLHRKVREVVASGAPAFFAAGNCGQDCPSGSCDATGVGPGRSIHAANSLAEVITVAGVNSLRERVGYSSQGPGMFEHAKPDLAAYTHFFGNFGPGRPGGLAQPYDNGTSAATPVAAGVGALLLGAFGDLTPAELKAALIAGATPVAGGWNPDYGHGVVDAAETYTRVLDRREGSLSPS